MDIDDDSGSASLHSKIRVKHLVQRRTTKKYILMLGVFSLILAACREETDLYFYTNQTWMVRSALTIDRAIIDLLPSNGGMELGFQLGCPVVDSQLKSGNWIDHSFIWMINELRN